MAFNRNDRGSRDPLLGFINEQLTLIWQSMHRLHSIAEGRNAFIRANLVCLRGLTPQQIENVPSMLITPELANEMSSCSICLDDYKLGNLEKQLPCSHIFHTDCIKNWLDTHNNCPMCRQPVVEERRNASMRATFPDRLQMQQGQQEHQVQLPAQQQTRRQVRWYPARHSPSRPTRSNGSVRSNNRAQFHRQRRNLPATYWNIESLDGFVYNTDYNRGSRSMRRQMQQDERRRYQN